MVGLIILGAFIFALCLTGILALRGAVIGSLKSQVRRAEVLIRTIRTDANQFDRLDSILSGIVIDRINAYDSEEIK